MLFEGRSIRDAVAMLMAREQTDELSGPLAALARNFQRFASSIGR